MENTEGALAGQEIAARAVDGTIAVVVEVAGINILKKDIDLLRFTG